MPRTDAVGSASYAQPRAVEQAAGSGEINAVGRGAPTLTIAGLGLEGMAALLSIESAQQAAKQLRELKHDEATRQVAEIAKQVDELHSKADAIRSEGLIAGSFTIAGGALTASSALMGPSSEQALHKGTIEGLAKSDPLTYSGGAAVAANAFDRSARVANVVASEGSTVAGIGNAISKGAQAAQADHEGASAQAAQRAKLAETARDEYESMAKQCDDVVAKAQQALLAFSQERMAAQKAILRSG